MGHYYLDTQYTIFGEIEIIIAFKLKGPNAIFFSWYEALLIYNSLTKCDLLYWFFKHH